MFRVKNQNQCISCGCKAKGSDGCDPVNGKCICNTKAISGPQQKCEIYSCNNDSDCSSGAVCWQPSKHKNIYRYFNYNPGKINCFNIYIMY